ncbi:MAG: FAD-binding oxidoreductase, partial [Burkholderiaceae bacterium]
GSSQIGGNLSTNAGGNNVIRYGMAREQVLGLEVVLADGRLLEFLSPLRKNNAGYDLKGVFLGSEGTLGLITAATLRLRPAARSRATMLVGLQGIGAVMSFFERTQSGLGECLTAVELIPRAAIDLVLGQFPDTREPFAQATAWALLVEAESASRFFDLEAAMSELFQQAQEAGEVADGNLAASQTQRAAFWTLRERMAHVMIDSPICLKMDTAVPVARIPEFLGHAAQAVARVLPGCRPIPFGHVGDGNIHFNVLGTEGMGAGAFDAHRAALAHVIEDCATALGGTVSAEHGIGLLKKQALVRMRSNAERDVMTRIRSALDPVGLLNPGKVFDIG